MLAAIVFALFARTFLFQAFEVPSSSMEKNVLTGDRLLVNKFVLAPSARPFAALMPSRGVRRGDIVVFRFPEDPRRDFLKRVIGLPGETVSEQTGRVLIDGKPLNEPYVKPANRDSQTAAWHVPAGSYFLMGDNRARSCDSRKFGSVAKQAIVGRVVLTYWPFDRISAG